MADYYTKYDAYLVDSDLDARMRLKQATTSVSSFGKVVQASKLKECIDRLKAGDKADVIFISYRFDREEVMTFIADAKQIPNSQDAAFILVLQTKDQQSSTIANNVLSGADGFLFEPYSVDQLVEITALAAKVKKERSAFREEAALKFLLSDVMNQIDQIAYLKSCEYETGPSLKKFKDMCTVFRALQGESLASYFKIVVDVFEEAPLPKKIFQRKKYAGASSRVAKRMEKKAMSELGLEGSEEAAPAPSEETAK